MTALADLNLDQRPQPRQCERVVRPAVFLASMRLRDIGLACCSDGRCLLVIRSLCFVVGILVLSADAVGHGGACPSWSPAQQEQRMQTLGRVVQPLSNSLRNLPGSRTGSGIAQNIFATHLQPVLASNGDNCASCHSAPRPGGTSKIAVTRLLVPPDADGNHNSIVLHSTGEITPALKNGIRADRITLSLSGDAYIEAVDEGEIRKIMAFKTSRLPRSV